MLNLTQADFIKYFLAYIDLEMMTGVYFFLHRCFVVLVYIIYCKDLAGSDLMTFVCRCGLFGSLPN
jgi:hypothetical protein